LSAGDIGAAWSEDNKFACPNGLFMQKIKNDRNNIRRQSHTFVLCVLSLYILFAGCFAPANIYAASQVQTSGATLLSKVAPGEFLPVSVKLLNFGNGNRVDVTLTYKIVSVAGKEIYNAEETVAVQTTATFVKTIQIPFDTIPGQYIVESSIKYADQLAPASGEFTFTVERKIFGLFQSDFYLYGGVTLLFGILMLALGYALIKHRRKVRFTQFDYSEIPRGERSFYEILSDTIMQMRQRVGDDALIIAENIEGLQIDKQTGRVLALTEKPSKIIATLVAEYEDLLGKKVSFSFRQK
jgi:hypothetical protein